MESRQKARKRNRCSSLYKMLKEFCEYTSCGGLGRVVGTKFVVFKLLWVLIFLVAFGWAVYQLILLLWKYQSRPISTKISLHYNSTLAFPSVVLCNFNMIRKSMVSQLPFEARAVLEEFISEKRIPSGEASLITPENEGELEEEDYDPGRLDGLFRKEEKVSVVMAELSETHDLDLFGHQFEKMIRSCTFKGVNCRNFTKHWSTFWHYKYGNCYIFNPYHKKGKHVRAARASKSGPLYGLAIEMDIEQEEYIDQLTQNAGVVVLVSVRGKMHFPYEEGLHLAPGFSTSMGVRLLQINRVDRFNNGSCVKPGESKGLNLYKNEYNVSYSKTACEQSCMAYQQRIDCKCQEYRFPQTSHVDTCDILNRTTALCLEKVARKARNNDLICSSKCRPLCSDLVYEISSSFSSWPSQNFEKHLAKELEEEKRNHSSVGGITKNHLKFHVFFQDLNYQAIDESISYLLENFLSDIGGQLGLWLGVSVLSGVELVELLAFMLIYLFGGKGNTVKLDDPIEMEEGRSNNIKTATNF